MFAIALNEMKCSSSIVASCVLLSVAACRTEHEAALDSGERSLFAHIAAGQTVLWGGNIIKLQSQLEALMSGVMPLLDRMGFAGQSLTKYMVCFNKLSSRPTANGVGGLRIADGAIDMTYAMSGFSIEELVSCSADAGMAFRVDPDRHFMVQEVPRMIGQPAGETGYLVLPDQALYARQSIKIAAGTPSAPPVAAQVTRAALQAEVAALADPKANAATDPLLGSLGGKVDHHKTLWFIANAANTSARGKLGEIYGTLDVASGFALDVTAQLLQKDLADKAEQAIHQVKAMADQVPADFRDIIKSLKFERTGDRLHLQAAISDAQFKSLMVQLGSMILITANQAGDPPPEAIAGSAH